MVYSPERACNACTLMSVCESANSFFSRIFQAANSKRIYSTALYPGAIERLSTPYRAKVFLSHR